MKPRLLSLSIPFALGTAVHAMPAFAQEDDRPPATSRSATIEEVVVSARRREESLQEVPIFVNVTSGDQLDALKILRFSELETIVPGLSLNETSANTASIRGVSFDTLTSGNNATVEFYLNDAHISGVALLRSLFDVGQIEVLRGPQGTLRGRAAPSGSITVTTRRPDLEAMGGYLNTTLNDIGGTNLQAALNLPLIDQVLAVRIAGLYEETEGNRVASIHHAATPARDSKGHRITLAAEPFDALSLVASYSRLDQDSLRFAHAEAASIANPLLSAAPVPLRAAQRRAVQRTPIRSDERLEQYNFQLDYRFGRHRLNYVGAHHRQRSDSFGDIVGVGDPGAFFGPEFGQIPADFGQYQSTDQRQYLHEVRLSSSEPLFGGRLDYVVGGFSNRISPDTDLERESLILLTHLTGFAVTPTTPALLLFTPTLRRAETREQSLFGNVTLHLTQATELSAGVRHIEFENQGSLIVPALGGVVPQAEVDEELDDLIYQLALSHRVADNVMVYASYGTSWRPSNPVVGNFSIAQTALERGFQNPPPEESDSLELGIKSTLLDNRLRLNVAVFRQEFDNYPYRSPDVFYVHSDPAPGGAVESVRRFGFVGAVPVTVHGLELDASLQATEHWSVGGVFSWAKGEIDGGLIPCNDYFPADGIPDRSGQFPTQPAQIRAATGGDNLSSCRVDFRASDAPLWSASIQSEYFRPLGAEIEGYVRGQLSLYGDSKGDQSNPYDDVDSYQLLNLYAGIRSGDGRWDLGLYAKNVTNTERVLTRAANPLTVAYRTAVPAAAAVGVSSYREVTMTPEREVGISLRWAFGSR